MYASVLHVHTVEPNKDLEQSFQSHASRVFRTARPLRQSLSFFPSHNLTLNKVLVSKKTLKFIEFLLATIPNVDVGPHPENLCLNPHLPSARSTLESPRVYIYVQYALCTTLFDL